jgi:hypothetical protein
MPRPELPTRKSNQGLHLPAVFCSIVAGSHFIASAGSTAQEQNRSAHTIRDTGDQSDFMTVLFHLNLLTDGIAGL